MAKIDKIQIGDCPIWILSTVAADMIVLFWRLTGQYNKCSK